MFKACRRYSHEGNCVSACPATRFYDVHTSSWKVNKEGRVALGHMCVSKCPGMSVTEFIVSINLLYRLNKRSILSPQMDSS